MTRPPRHNTPTKSLIFVLSTLVCSMAGSLPFLSNGIPAVEGFVNVRVGGLVNVGVGGGYAAPASAANINAYNQQVAAANAQQRQAAMRAQVAEAKAQQQTQLEMRRVQMNAEIQRARMEQEHSFNMMKIEIQKQMEMKKELIVKMHREKKLSSVVTKLNSTRIKSSKTSRNRTYVYVYEKFVSGKTVRCVRKDSSGAIYTNCTGPAPPTCFDKPDLPECIKPVTCYGCETTTSIYIPTSTATAASTKVYSETSFFFTPTPTTTYTPTTPTPIPTIVPPPVIVRNKTIAYERCIANRTRRHHNRTRYEHSLRNYTRTFNTTQFFNRTVMFNYTRYFNETTHRFHYKLQNTTWSKTVNGTVMKCPAGFVYRKKEHNGLRRNGTVTKVVAKSGQNTVQRQYITPPTPKSGQTAGSQIYANTVNNNKNASTATTTTGTNIYGSLNTASSYSLTSAATNMFVNRVAVFVTIFAGFCALL